MAKGNGRSGEARANADPGLTAHRITDEARNRRQSPPGSDNQAVFPRDTAAIERSR